MIHDQLIHDVYLFQELDANELEVVAAIAELQTLDANAEVFKQGDTATALYIIKSGIVRIHQKSSEGDNIEVAVLGEGSHFGEMPLIDGEARSATATVVENAEIVVLDFQKTLNALEENSKIAVKFYRAIARFLCGRLRVTTSDLSYARERNLRFF